MLGSSVFITVAHAVEARFLLLGADASRHQGTETAQDDGSRHGRKAVVDANGLEWRDAETTTVSALRDPDGKPSVLAGTMAVPASIRGGSEVALTATGAARAEPAIRAERLASVPMRISAMQRSCGFWTAAVRALMRCSEQTSRGQGPRDQESGGMAGTTSQEFTPPRCTPRRF